MTYMRAMAWLQIRRTVWLLGAVGLALPGVARGQDPKPVPKEVEHRPTALPDRVILTWTGDPARSQAVTWRTDTSVTKALAQIALAEPGPKFVAKAQNVSATTTPLKTDLGEAHYHSVGFTTLSPKTKYVYRVGDGVNWSEWFQFQTASAGPEPFTFIYFGDAQTDVKSMWSRVIREAYSDAAKARFIIHAGDLINRANQDYEWGEWFKAGGWVNGMVPSIPSPGNHEYDKDAQANRRAVSRHWRPQFALPEHGPAGLEETVYYIDYQGVRIVSLNSNEGQAQQVEWLEKVLGNNPNKWTVLTFHHPIFSTAKGRDNAKLRQLWQPVFDKYRVDLVLQGHDHTYARSGLLTAEKNVAGGANVRDARSGTVYVVSVSGPKMYRLERMEWMKQAVEDTQLYQIISVDGNKLHYEARTAIGNLYDAIELRKNGDGVNTLVEKEQLGLTPRKPNDPSRRKAAVLAAGEPANGEQPRRGMGLAQTPILAAVLAMALGLGLLLVKRGRLANRAV
jgi:3',5'-cyclic AMP phosphodiesterase CpdA